MGYFINKDKKLYSFVLSNGIFSLYKNDDLILDHKTKLKSVHLPVEPIFVNNILILFDYDKGIEIVNNGNSIFVKIRAVYMADIINEFIFAFTHKKMYIINYVTGLIVEERNISENFDFALDNKYAFFYRINRNQSYIYQIESNKIIELGNSLKDDMLIQKLVSSDNYIYIFCSMGSSEDGEDIILQYNIKTNEFRKDKFALGSAVGHQYLDYFSSNVNEKINIKSDDYCETIYLIFKKFGIFLAFNVANSEKLCESKNSKYYWIYSFYSKYVKIMENFRVLKSCNDLVKLENEVNNLSVEIDRYYNLCSK